MSKMHFMKLVMRWECLFGKTSFSHVAIILLQTPLS